MLESSDLFYFIDKTAPEYKEMMSILESSMKNKSCEQIRFEKFESPYEPIFEQPELTFEQSEQSEHSIDKYILYYNTCSHGKQRAEDRYGTHIDVFFL